MKKIALSVLLCFISIFSHAQSNAADKLIGVWLSEEKDGKIEIYKTGTKYFGKIIGGNDLIESDGTPRKDDKNPDKKLKTRPILNMIILTNFIYEDGAWTDGKIYDPKSGKTYSSTMKLNGDKLELRGFIGVSLFGRTTVWERDK
jgi:uncharacterized protein (DUF2147 family)